MRNTALNDKQLAVLKWVREGCADGVYQGTAHRLVARALHHRKLIVVNGNGPSWSARITDEGTYYLEHGERLPADNRPQAVDRTLADDLPESGRSRQDRPSKTRKHGPVDQLMTSLTEAPDHRIAVPASEAGKYRRLAGMARNHDRIPDGFRISFGHSRDSSGLMVTLMLEPVPPWQTRVLDPTHVSRMLSSCDVVRVLMDSESFPVAGEPRDRAFRLMEALVVGAREAGMTVETGYQTHGRSRPAARTRDEVTFRIGQDVFQLRFTQATLRRPHEPTEQELAKARRGYLLPDFDEVPDEHLGLVLDGPGAQFWGGAWKDTGEHRLEDDLAQVLEEIQLRHGYLADMRLREQERQRQAQEARAEHQKRIEAARERAVAAHREHMIDEDARDQARRWQEANNMRAYAAEVRRRAAELDTDGRERAWSWAERITQVADAVDPFPGEAVPPQDIAEPSESDLRPFMGL
ncbi:hypothetical protein IOD16_18140 [Saccharothrix sp. 6-C]|uniref:hypothetical protein n=1 Tax=Saccharothrix sp. 6-C TaxID=2781735 RepID=UPI00191729A4|nr:hypothetical protein [Saccharothrix sp. 6-C]QQQ80132.1 hypothetical protein IOD16_18140 [Saccharothrix sp. 6-C]